MDGFNVQVNCEDGSVSSVKFNTGMEIIQALLRTIPESELKSPPRHIIIYAKDSNTGKNVAISIPYDGSDQVRVI